jgi:membrane-bound ClpP family serine protease
LSIKHMNTRLILAVITSLLDEAIIVALILWGLPRLGINIPPWVTIIAAVLFAVYAVTVFRLGTRILKKKPVSGLTEMLGMEGKVIHDLKPDGYVQIEGEIWAAQAETGTIVTGTSIVVVKQNRLKLIVKPGLKETYEQ